jgi:hypothetical protein
MKNLLIKNLTMQVLILIFSGICFAGFSQKKPDQPTQKDGVKLEYNYPAGKSFKYVTDTKIVQDMDINGQSMLVNVAIYLGCQVKSAGKEGQNQKLEIIIDSLAQNVESPQGSAGGSATDVKGKVFNMIISPAGKIVDLTEAAKIVYNLEGSGERTLDQSFNNFFPALPANAVKPGETWVSHDTIDTKTPTSSDSMLVETNSKFEGIENIDGIDCAKITSIMSGTRKMVTQAQGMEIHTAGPFTGTITLLIAVKEGYLVKESVTSKLTGNIDIPDQGMSFPVVMDITSTNAIVK